MIYTALEVLYGVCRVLDGRTLSQITSDQYTLYMLSLSHVYFTFIMLAPIVNWYTAPLTGLFYNNYHSAVHTKIMQTCLLNWKESK